MLARAEQAHHAVLAAKGFEPVEYRLRVVQYGGGGVQAERAVGLNAGFAPPLSFPIRYRSHVVGEDDAEGQVAVPRLRLQGGGARHGDRCVH